jgi:DNA repair exonuclease SbcCD nuclease subunit
MKLIFFTDPHITDKTPASRTDNYPESLLKKFQTLCADIIKHGPDYVICGGDWTDKPRISVDLAGAFNREVKRTLPTPWYCVPGSHDTVGYNYSALNNTMLGYACRSGVLNLLGRDKSTVIQHKDVKVTCVVLTHAVINMDIINQHIHVRVMLAALDIYVLMLDYRTFVPAE